MALGLEPPGSKPQHVQRCHDKVTPCGKQTYPQKVGQGSSNREPPSSHEPPTGCPKGPTGKHVSFEGSYFVVGLKGNTQKKHIHLEGSLET